MPTPWASTTTFDSPCPRNQVTKNSLDFGAGAEREHPNNTESVSTADRQLAARNFRNSLGTILIRLSFNPAALTHSILMHLGIKFCRRSSRIILLNHVRRLPAIHLGGLQVGFS